MMDIPPFALPDLAGQAARALPAGTRAWLVGGAVRDALLGRRVQDFDFVVDAPALPAARAVARALGADLFLLDSERDVARVIVLRPEGRCTLDFARLRGASLADDLASRDFTLNAMAVDLASPGQVIDPLGGWPDLRARLIRACGPGALAADPVRAVRAVRLAAQLDFRLERETRAAARAQAGALLQVSAERRRDEFIRCLGGPRPAAALRALDMLGLLAALVPELAGLKGLAQPPPHALDAWEHTLAAVARLHEILSVLAPAHDVDAASDLMLGLVSVQLGRHRLRLADHLGALLGGERPARWLLMLAGLLHDAAKPLTRHTDEAGRVTFAGHDALGAGLAADRMEALHFSGEEVRRVRTIIACHDRPRRLSKRAGPVTDRDIYRFFRQAGAVGVDVVLLSLADFLSKFGGSPPPQDEWARHVEVCARLMTAYFERAAEVVNPAPLVNGHDLMAELGLPPGPRLGELLESLREAQAAGEVPDRNAALDYVRELLSG